LAPDGPPGRLLQLGVAVDLDVRGGPEIVQVLALLREQAVPSGCSGRGQRGAHLAVLCG
jgi:hypothetical protein